CALKKGTDSTGLPALLENAAKSTCCCERMKNPPSTPKRRSASNQPPTFSAPPGVAPKSRLSLPKSTRVCGCPSAPGLLSLELPVVTSGTFSGPFLMNHSKKSDCTQNRDTRSGSANQWYPGPSSVTKTGPGGAGGTSTGLGSG